MALEPFRYSQFQLHIHGPGNRVGAVGSHFLEPKLAIHGDRIFHDWLNGVKAHALITDLVRFGDDAIGQDASQALAAKPRAQVKALHLADAWLQFVERADAGELTVVSCEQKAALRRGVVTR